jgi:choline dehydrogenase
MRSTPDLTAPDIQLIFGDVPYHPPTMPGPANGYTILFAALRPRSRGSVRLAGPDPTTAPLIDPNLLGDDRDLVTMLTALAMAHELGASPALAEWRDEEALPGSDGQDVASYATTCATTQARTGVR